MNRKDNWCFDGAACGRLGSLVQVISPSMNERAMASRLRTLWADAGIDTVTDVMGNLHGVANPSGTIHVGLAAHMDTVAIQITRILPGGQMQFRSIGLSQYVLLGQRMKVLTGHGCVDGVIGFSLSGLMLEVKSMYRQAAMLMVINVFMFFMFILI